MPEVLCTQCGAVGPDAGGRCGKCASTDVLPADSPIARKFIDQRNARKTGAASTPLAERAEVTGKVLGRTFGKLFKK